MSDTGAINRAKMDTAMHYQDVLEQRDLHIEELEQQISALESSISRLTEENRKLREVVKLFYRKHNLGDGRIGWSELGEKVFTILADCMGDEQFNEWADQQLKEVNNGNYRQDTP